MTRITPAVVIAFLFILAPGLAHAAEALGTPKDQEAIRQLIAETTQAFNEHKAKEFAQLYTEDADLVTVRGERMSGRGGIEKGLGHIFRTRAKGATLGTIETTIRFITPDVAVVHILNELSGLVRDGKQEPSHRELSVKVVVKRLGAWRVAAFHNTLVKPF